MQARAHQQKQLEFLKNRRLGLVCACCGSGKTVTQLLALEHFETYASSSPASSDAPLSFLAVFILPWLVLSSQLLDSYINGPAWQRFAKLTVSSEGVLDPERIKTALQQWGKKLVIVTYHSLPRVVHAILELGLRPDLCCFDEAHHATEFGKYDAVSLLEARSRRSFYFTATPTRELRDMVGAENQLNYTLQEAVDDGVCNSWDFTIMFVRKGDNDMGLLQAVAKAYFQTGRGRILLKCGLATATRGMLTRATDFTKADAIEAFESIRHKCFRRRRLPNIRVESLVASASAEDRHRILNQEFDNTADDEVYLLAFCNTLAEGIDTKNANMIVFVDEPNSRASITQCIGRVQRKPYGVDTPRAVVLRVLRVCSEEYMRLDPDTQSLLLRRDVGEQMAHVVGALRDQRIELAARWAEDDQQAWAPRTKKQQQEKDDSAIVQTAATKDVRRCPQILFDDSLLYLSTKARLNFRKHAQLAVIEIASNTAHAKARVKQQVAWLCELYDSNQPPKTNAKHTLETGSGRSVCFSARKFLEHVRGNWIDKVPCNTSLGVADRKLIEKLPWFKQWLQDTNKRAGVKDRIRHQVSNLCKLWPAHEAPIQKRSECIPGSTEKFDGGRFLCRIKATWFGGACNTSLREEDIRRIEGLPWFRERLKKWGAQPKYSKSCSLLKPTPEINDQCGTEQANKAIADFFTAHAEGSVHDVRREAIPKFKSLGTAVREFADVLEPVLRGIPESVWKCESRGDVDASRADTSSQFTLGLLWNRNRCAVLPTRATMSYPNLTRLVLAFFKLMLPRIQKRSNHEPHVTTIQVTRNFRSSLHKDSNNMGWSYIFCLGTYAGGRTWAELEPWEHEQTIDYCDMGSEAGIARGRYLNAHGVFQHFDGTKLHCTESFEGERIALILFCNNRYDLATTRVKDHARNLGFILPGDKAHLLDSSKGRREISCSRVQKRRRFCIVAPNLD